jgi:hypothetical protein
VSEERRPAFAKGFPRIPELDELVRAFAEGDYARVRGEATKLADSTKDDEVRRAARELASRVRADPLAAWLLVITLALLVFLTAWWIVHGHPPPAQNPSPPPPAVEHVR